MAGGRRGNRELHLRYSAQMTPQKPPMVDGRGTGWHYVARAQPQERRNGNPPFPRAGGRVETARRIGDDPLSYPASRHSSRPLGTPRYAAQASISFPRFINEVSTPIRPHRGGRAGMGERGAHRAPARKGRDRREHVRAFAQHAEVANDAICIGSVPASKVSKIC